MIRRALIHAGGEGTRLRPITYEIPKPLVPVQGKPILTWLIEWLMRYGVTDILVTIPPKWKQAFEKWKIELPEDVRSHIKLWEEPKPMGTMGAVVHHLRDEFGDESLFVTNGDELKGFDLSKLAALHEQEEYGATLGLVQVPNPSDYGSPDLEGSRVTRFREKPADPTTNLAHAGLYAFDPRILKDYSFKDEFLMFEKDLFPKLTATGQLGACELAGQWYDCGTIERWDRAIKEWKP